MIEVFQNYSFFFFNYKAWIMSLAANISVPFEIICSHEFLQKVYLRLVSASWVMGYRCVPPLLAVSLNEAAFLPCSLPQPCSGEHSLPLFTAPALTGAVGKQFSHHGFYWLQRLAQLTVWQDYENSLNLMSCWDAYKPCESVVFNLWIVTLLGVAY